MQYLNEIMAPLLLNYGSSPYWCSRLLAMIKSFIDVWCFHKKRKNSDEVDRQSFTCHFYSLPLTNSYRSSCLCWQLQHMKEKY